MANPIIAILEDDEMLSQALKKALEKNSFEVMASKSPEEVVEFLNNNPVNTLFVDCLLPVGSGVDVVVEVRKKHPASLLNVVMMSGIFTDASFVKDTVRATQASSFLKKPFDLADAVACVKVAQPSTQTESRSAESPRKEIYNLFSKPKVSVREKRKAIEALDEMHGFDLPYLYSLLVETQATGHLNIVGAKGELSGITFSHGKIVGVDIVDQETQIGKLLIQAGFVFPDDLRDALTENGNKRVGEKLIQKGLLSPHAFNIGMANQMSIRLSRTITDSPIKVNFVATEVELTVPHIDSDSLSVFLHDWIASKISLSWLKSHYVQWEDYVLMKTPSFTPDHPILSMPLIAHFTGLTEYFTSGLPLGQLLETKKFPEDSSYKALYLLLAKGLFAFNEVPVVQSTGATHSVKKLLAQVQGKNKLEVWDFMVRITRGEESQPAQIFSDFMRLLGPEPIANLKDPISKEAAKSYLKLKSLAEESFTFCKSGNRDKMKEEIARSEIEGKIKAASLFEEGKAALQKAQYSIASPLFVKAISADPGLEKIKLYQIWAKLGVSENQMQKTQILRDVELELMQVPPEEKFDHLFSFVMGLYYKAKGDFGQAKKSFEKAAYLDASFIPAKRELSLLGNAAKPKDVFNRDLKDFVAGFFKKR
jgi:FixJ family two-component response regulator/tetratricopeptide (TPR) repeat protein